MAELDQKQIDSVNADGTTFDIEPVMSRAVEEDETLPVMNKAVHEVIAALLSEAQSLVTQAQELLSDSLQNKALTTPVTIAGTSYNTVQDAITALAENYTATPASGSQKFFTAGGAFADKSSTPASGSTKCFTAGGAATDKSAVPAVNSTKCFTAGGAYKYFAKQTTALAWLKKLFGSDYETKLANGYFVD